MDERSPDDSRLTPVLLRRDLLAQGLNDKSIAGLVRGGVLHRVRYGSYVDAAAWTACDPVGRHGLQARAVLLRAQAEVVLSHLSALGEWDIPVWDLSQNHVHITRVDQRAGRREAGVIQHLGALRGADVVEKHGIRVTSPTRTALDCLGLVDTEHGIAIVGDLLHRGLTTRELLDDARDFMAQWPGSLRHQLVTSLADARCESVAEHRFVYLCREQHLPPPIPQFQVVDPHSDFRARLDFAWPEAGLFVEMDGRVKYGRYLRPGEDAADAVWREKLREQRICEITGWRCLRLVWADLYHRQDTAERVRRMLIRRASEAG